MPRLNSKLRTGSRYAKIALCAAAAAGLVGISAARADTTDILLEELRAKGVLTKHEYKTLKARHAAEKATTRRALPPGVMVTKGPAPEFVTVCPTHVCMRVGQVDVKLSGDLVFAGIESFATRSSGTAVNGGVAGGLVGTSHNATNGISGGLLPSSLALSLATNQMGYDLGFTIAAYVGGGNVLWTGGANSTGNPEALGTPGIDLRQVFGTVGTPTMGTFKVGRDLGLFASDAILNDATLLGVGTSVPVSEPSNTTLGRIGLGYVYADWLPGVTYTTPNFNGFTATVAAYTPYDSTDGVGAFSSFTPSPVIGSPAPMLQGQVKFKGDLGGGTKLTLSADAVWQEHQYDTASVTTGTPLVGSTINSWGIDGFGKVDIAGFSLVAYGYYGAGLGTTGLFLNGFSLDGQQRDSYGGYAQGSYTFFDKFTLGASWGISYLEANSYDNTVGVSNGYEPYMLRSNQSYVGFARYQITTWMAIQGEYAHSISTNQSGGQIQGDQIDLGTAWFF